MLQENTSDLVSVSTARDFVRSPSWKCIFDWEDDISAFLGLPLDILTKPGKLSRLLCDPKTFDYSLPILRRMLNKSDKNIAIVYLMAPENIRFLLKSNKRFIPIFIDTPTSSYNSLRKLGKVFPIYYVISHESYEYLAVYNQNVRFLPFSVPEIWKQARLNSLQGA